MEEIITKEEVIESLEKKLDDVERYKYYFSSLYLLELSNEEREVMDAVMDWADEYVGKLFDWERRLDRGEDPYKVYQEYARFPDNPVFDESKREVYSSLNLALVWAMLR